MKNCYLILLLFLFCSCRDQSNLIDERTVFRYNEHANVTTVDPAFANDQRNIWVCNLLYNGLTRLNNELKVVPDLARSWRIDNSATQYTFTLKDSIYFNDAFAKARPVTASDFKYSLERLADPELAAKGAWVMKNVKEIKALDTKTLQITLKQPFPAFLGLLTMKFCSVIPKGHEPQRDQPIGTGPFYLKQWQENVKMVLRRNHLYHEKDDAGNRLPYLEAVAITFKTDKQSEFLEFAQGNLDFINAIDPSYKDELLTAQGDLKSEYNASIELKKSPFLNTEYLGIKIDGSSTELQNKELRKAINYGFNRVKMVKYLRNNIGIPAQNGFIPHGIPGGGITDGFAYDPLKAKRLVDSYKKQSGNSNPSITISTAANYLDLCEFIQKELENIGIQTSINVMTPSTLREDRKDGKLDIFRSSWIADYPDAENYLMLFYSKNFTPSGPNYTHFKNKTFDSMYENTLVEKDARIREKLYIKMDSIIVEEAPIIPLYYDQSIRFISKKVLNMEVNAVNMLDLTRVKKVD